MFRKTRKVSQEARALEAMAADPRDEITTCMHGVPFPCGLCHPHGYNGLPVTRTAGGTYAAARTVEAAPPLGDRALYEETYGRYV